MEPVIVEGVPPAPNARRSVEGVVTARGRGMHLLSFMKTAPNPAVCLPPPVELPHPEERRKKVDAEEEEEEEMDAEPNTTKHPEATTSNEQEIFGEDATRTKTVRGPVFKDGKAVFPYGNYLNYYSSEGHRGTQDLSEDVRLKAVAQKLGKDVFNGKDVIDIGCNSGAVSLSVLRHFGAHEVLGVDIDLALIEAAEENLTKQREVAGESLDVNSAFGRVTFKTQNIVASEPPEKDAFDVALCLSVTKWIHFAHGDKGIRKLFRRCGSSLRPGGILVLEPQDWKSYKKKRHLTSEIRQSVAGIELRPEKFDEFLVSMGFESLGVVEPEHAISQGFNRTIFLYRKPVGGLAVNRDMDSTGSGFAPSRREELDVRLQALMQKLGKKALKGKDVLDVGCGKGSLSLSVVGCCHAASAVGIDVDESCIQAADSSKDGQSLSNQVTFRAEDFVCSTLQTRGAFDVVLCLMVTKGVHFAHGDAGIRKLFKRCEKSLRPGGTIVLEAQEWQSYTKSRQHALELRPEHFGDFLIGLGFESLGAAEPSDEPFQGLKRPLYFYRKPSAVSEDISGASTEKKRKGTQDSAESTCIADPSSKKRKVRVEDAIDIRAKKKAKNLKKKASEVQGTNGMKDEIKKSKKSKGGA